MAAIILKPGAKFDPTETFKQVTNNLPGYACPRFIRLTESIEHTATFKQKKLRLVQEGFDPQLVTDSLFFYKSSEMQYIPLDKELHTNILNGVVRV